VSALNFPGNSSRILDLAEAGKIRLAVSDDILNEVKRVLLRPKFGWSQDRVDAAIRQIAGFAEHVEPAQRIDIVVDDPTDNRILECAFASVRITSLAGITTCSRSGSIRVARSCRRRSFSRFSRNEGANASRGSINRSHNSPLGVSLSVPRVVSPSLRNTWSAVSTWVRSACFDETQSGTS